MDQQQFRGRPVRISHKGGVGKTIMVPILTPEYDQSLLLPSYSRITVPDGALSHPMDEVLCSVMLQRLAGGPVIEDIIGYRDAHRHLTTLLSDTEVLTTATAMGAYVALMSDGTDEERAAMLSMDPVEALIRLSNSPVPAARSLFSGVSIPLSVIRDGVPPESRMESYRRIAIVLTSFYQGTALQDAGHTIRYTDNVQLDHDRRGVPSSATVLQFLLHPDFMHQNCACEYSAVFRNENTPQAPMMQIRTSPLVRMERRLTFRDHLLPAVLAAYSGIGPDVVEQMLGVDW